MVGFVWTDVCWMDVSLCERGVFWCCAVLCCRVLLNEWMSKSELGENMGRSPEVEDSATMMSSLSLPVAPFREMGSDCCLWVPRYLTLRYIRGWFLAATCQNPSAGCLMFECEETPPNQGVSRLASVSLQCFHSILCWFRCQVRDRALSGWSVSYSRPIEAEPLIVIHPSQ